MIEYCGQNSCPAIKKVLSSAHESTEVKTYSMKFSFGKKIDATKGNLTKILWKMAWPLIIINLIQVLYNFADTFWVGQLEYSAHAIAAVSTSFSIIFVMISLAIGLNIATASLVSQYFGAKDHKNLEASCFTAIILIGALALFLSAVGLVFREQLLQLINTPQQIYDYALEYYSIIMYGMVFAFMFYVLSGIMRGVGDVVTPMVAGIVSGIINMILDPFLIFGWGPFPELGIAGAAYATIIARALVFIYLLWYVFSGRHHLNLHIRDAKMHWHLAKKMVKIAVPASIAQVALTLSGFVLFARVNMFGAVASSAYSLGARIDSLLFLPSMSFSQATATIVGQNIGAQKKHRATKATLIAIIHGGIIAFVLSTLLMIFPTAIFDLLFAKVSEEVLSLARNYVMIISLGYAFLSVRIIINGVFQGAGASIHLMVTTIISLALRVGLGYALSYTTLGIEGLFIGISISFVLSAAFMFIVFRKAKWQDVSLINPKATSHSQIEDGSA